MIAQCTHSYLKMVNFSESSLISVERGWIRTPNGDWSVKATIRLGLSSVKWEITFVAAGRKEVPTLIALVSVHERIQVANVCTNGNCSSEETVRALINILQRVQHTRHNTSQSSEPEGQHASTLIGHLGAGEAAHKNEQRGYPCPRFVLQWDKNVWSTREQWHLPKCIVPVILQSVFNAEERKGYLIWECQNWRGLVNTKKIQTSITHCNHIQLRWRWQLRKQ